MKTSEFIAALRAAPQDRLLFVNEAGDVIHAGYHLTELKAASVQTVDCGGQVNRWEETVVQLWVPPEADDTFMTAGKFLAIFDRVRGMIPLNLDTEMRVEYGDDHFFPSIYHLLSLTRAGHDLRVLLGPPEATCKARDRQTCAAETCCA